jgi:hypothetical protein
VPCRLGSPCTEKRTQGAVRHQKEDRGFGRVRLGGWEEGRDEGRREGAKASELSRVSGSGRNRRC